MRWIVGGLFREVGALPLTMTRQGLLQCCGNAGSTLESKGSRMGNHIDARPRIHPHPRKNVMIHGLGQHGHSAGSNERSCRAHGVLPGTPASPKHSQRRLRSPGLN